MLGKKIVVVDDDENIRKTFFLILNKSYRVYLAKDGQEVLDRFKKADVDLVIADYKLPSMTGVELVAELRKNGFRGEVIMISAHPDMIEPDLLSRLSISHFFSKPLDLTALSRAIDYLLNRRDQAEKRI
ncbi:MAG: response regulator [Candidatus Aminicenantes bacterium]|jgi:DNA-binding response OmpR family regulator|nr:response regulator [Candidatus Aminicenantes bacterium]